MTKVYRITQSTNVKHYGDNNNGTITIKDNKTKVTFYTQIKDGNTLKMAEETDKLNPIGEDGIFYQSKTNKYQWDFAFIGGTTQAIDAFIRANTNAILTGEAEKITVDEKDKGSIFVLYSVENFVTPQARVTTGPGGGTGAGSLP